MTNNKGDPQTEIATENGATTYNNKRIARENIEIDHGEILPSGRTRNSLNRFVLRASTELVNTHDRDDRTATN